MYLIEPEKTARIRKFQWYKEEMRGNILCCFENEECYDRFNKTNIESVFYLLPRSIVLGYYAGHFKVAFVEKIDILDEAVKGDLDFCGFFLPAAKIILIPFENGYSKESLENSILHEFGHFADFMKGEKSGGHLSYSKKFERIAKKESNKWRYAEAAIIQDILHSINKHLDLEEIVDKFREDLNYYNNSQEYFAESFCIYLLKPMLLKEYAPKTTRFIRQTFGTFVCNSKDFDVKNALKFLFENQV